MSANKIDVTAIPKEMLGDLQSLITTSKKDYIAVNNSFYEIIPTSATKLMEVMAAYTDILDKARERKVAKMLKINPDINPLHVFVVVNDLMSDTEAGEGIREILASALDGVAESDLEKMNIGQMFDSLDKMLRINVSTLPKSFQDEINATPVIPDVPEDDEDTDAKNP